LEVTGGFTGSTAILGLTNNFFWFALPTADLHTLLTNALQSGVNLSSEVYLFRFCFFRFY